MKHTVLFRDCRGAVLVEYAITLPIYLLLIFGALEAGLMMWTQVGLQHGAELAARCATTAQATSNAGQTPGQCLTNDSIKNFAASQTLGLNPPADNFTPHQVPDPLGICGTGYPGNVVTASYSFPIFGIYTWSTTSITLTAQACDPIPTN
jgi:Flp pilus assembly protein TadG